MKLYQGRKKERKEKDIKLQGLVLSIAAGMGGGFADMEVYI